MTELIVRRVVVACDAVCDIRPAIEEAATLAVRWRAALHGVFLEDENLFRLAGLPFGRQVTLLSATSESFGAADLQTLSTALGGAMRRALAKVATQHGLVWSFGIVRDLPTLSALAKIEGDLLIVESATRPFAGSWGPRSAWDRLGEEPARPILLRRREMLRKGVVAVLVGKGTDYERTLGAAFAMAGKDDEIAILPMDDVGVDIEALKRVGARLSGGQGRTFRLEHAIVDKDGLLQAVFRLNPALIVFDSGQTDGEVVRALLGGTRGDVLLMR